MFNRFGFPVLTRPPGPTVQSLAPPRESKAAPPRYVEVLEPLPSMSRDDAEYALVRIMDHLELPLASADALLDSVKHGSLILGEWLEDHPDCQHLLEDVQLWQILDAYSRGTWDHGITRVTFPVGTEGTPKGLTRSHTRGLNQLPSLKTLIVSGGRSRVGDINLGALDISARNMVIRISMDPGAASGTNYVPERAHIEFFLPTLPRAQAIKIIEIGHDREAVGEPRTPPDQSYFDHEADPQRLGALRELLSPVDTKTRSLAAIRLNGLGRYLNSDGTAQPVVCRHLSSLWVDRRSEYLQARQTALDTGQALPLYDDADLVSVPRINQSMTPKIVEMAVQLHQQVPMHAVEQHAFGRTLRLAFEALEGRTHAHFFVNLNVGGELHTCAVELRMEPRSGREPLKYVLNFFDPNVCKPQCYEMTDLRGIEKINLQEVLRHSGKVAPQGLVWFFAWPPRAQDSKSSLSVPPKGCHGGELIWYLQAVARKRDKEALAFQLCEENFDQLGTAAGHLMAEASPHAWRDFAEAVLSSEALCVKSRSALLRPAYEHASLSLSGHRRSGLATALRFGNADMIKAHFEVVEKACSRRILDGKTAQLALAPDAEMFEHLPVPGDVGRRDDLRETESGRMDRHARGTHAYVLAFMQTEALADGDKPRIFKGGSKPFFRTGELAGNEVVLQAAALCAMCEAGAAPELLGGMVKALPLTPAEVLRGVMTLHEAGQATGLWTECRQWAERITTAVKAAGIGEDTEWAELVREFGHLATGGTFDSKASGRVPESAAGHTTESSLSPQPATEPEAPVTWHPRPEARALLNAFVTVKTPVLQKTMDAQCRLAGLRAFKHEPGTTGTAGFLHCSASHEIPRLKEFLHVPGNTRNATSTSPCIYRIPVTDLRKFTPHVPS